MIFGMKWNGNMNMNTKEKILEYINTNDYRLIDELDNLKGSYAVKYVFECLPDTFRPIVFQKVLNIINNHEFFIMATNKLRLTNGVEAAFFIESNENYKRILVIAQEHENVQRSQLIDIERGLGEQFNCVVDISVWARQTRNLESFVEGFPNRLF